MPRLDHKPVPGIDTVYSLTLGELAEEPKRDCPPVNRATRKEMLHIAFVHYGSTWMGGLQSDVNSLTSGGTNTRAGQILPKLFGHKIVECWVRLSCLS